MLRALGRDTELAQSSLRISLGRFTTAADVDAAATAIRREVPGCGCWRGIPGRAGGAQPPAWSPTGQPAGACAEPARATYFLAAGPGPEVPGRVGAARDPPWAGPAGGREGTESCFELEINGGFVKSARFSAYGCPHTLAVTAWLCEVLEGARLDAGVPGTPADWAAQFDVPAEKLGRLLIVEDALRAAFDG